jgi:tetratricopeptide (TPR) repeat protein
MAMRRTHLIFLTVLFLCVNTAAQNNVGKIIALKGTARLQQSNGKVEILTEKNFARSLQPNQRLRVDRNGQMKIILCDGTTPFVTGKKWYPVPATVICSPSADSMKQGVIRKLFGIGARHRNGDGFILFPIESKEIIDTIRPETAVFRWGPTTTAKVNLSVSVTGVENKLWEKNNVSGEDGSFTDDDLKRFFKDVREKHPDARFQLKIQTTSNTTNTARFQLLPKEKDKALQQEIGNLKEENELLLHLFRAEIYLQYNLFIEAADEYEEALKLSPESIELLKATAAIEEYAGNLKRSDELENYIEELSKRTK